MPSADKNKKSKSKVSPEELRNRLKLRHIDAKQKFERSYPEADRYLKSKGVDLSRAREHSAKILGAGALAGSLLLTPSTSTKALPAPAELVEKVRLDLEKVDSEEDNKNQQLLVDTLNNFLPKRTRPLSRNEEKLLESLFRDIMGVNARATLEGEHLNTTYGRIGAEQHLRRYPGDTIDQHDIETQISGMAPGKGAWGYFSNSKDQMTPQLDETEKWYAVVQTLYLPDWNTRQPYLKDWYKHRKVLMVNTQNGNAVVASIADSGPAAWTGKHYGGSPEVMNYLGGSKYRKGPVIVFFVDDPENKVPLGPVEYNNKQIAGLLK